MKKDDKELYFAQNIPMPETPLPAGGVKPWQQTKVVGKPLQRVDAYERVSGNAVYPSDVVLSDMLYAAILRCPHPTCGCEGRGHERGGEDDGRPGCVEQCGQGSRRPVAMVA